MAQDMEIALKEELETLTGLSEKVFQAAAPESIKAPYLTYQLSNNERLKEIGINYNGSVDGQYQVDIVNTTYANTKSLMFEAISKIKSMWGRNMRTDGPYSEAVEIISEVGPYFESSKKQYQGVIEFIITYEE